MKVVQPGCGEMISWPDEHPALRVQTVQENREMARAAADRASIFQGILENKKTVFWICLGYARDFIEAEELAQEVFFKAWAKIDSLRDPERHREWLFRMARNV